MYMVQTHAFLFNFYRNYFNERSDVYFKNGKRFSMLPIQEAKLLWEWYKKIRRDILTSIWGYLKKITTKLSFQQVSSVLDTKFSNFLTCFIYLVQIQPSLHT